MNGQEADIRDEALLALIAAGGDPGDAAVTALYRRYRIVLLRFFLSQGALAGVNYFFRRRQLFLPVLSLHHWSTIAQSDAKSVRSSGSEISARFRS